MCGHMLLHIILMPTMKWKMVAPIRVRTESMLQSLVVMLAIAIVIVLFILVYDL